MFDSGQQEGGRVSVEQLVNKFSVWLREQKCPELSTREAQPVTVVPRQMVMIYLLDSGAREKDIINNENQARVPLRTMVELDEDSTRKIAEFCHSTFPAMTDKEIERQLFYPSDEVTSFINRVLGKVVNRGFEHTSKVTGREATRAAKQKRRENHE